MPSTPPFGARCAKHPVAAVDVCQRCGAFVCGECVNIRAEDVFCGDCARLLDRPRSARAKVALGLAAAPVPLTAVMSFAFGGIGTGIGLGLLIPLSAAAVALLLQERRAQTPRGAAYLLGWIAVALDALAIAAVLAVLVRYGPAF